MSGSSLSLEAGASLRDGRYSIEAVIGHGGFGITYRAVDTMLTRLVAIKEFFLAGSSRAGTAVRPPPNLREAFVERKDRIRDEARVLARFRHLNIVTVHEFFEENDTIYVVMELLEGRTLKDVLLQTGRPLTEQQALAYAREIGSALDAVHSEGLLHRDVKPDNVMVLSDGHVSMVDFGTAREFALGQSSPMSQTLTPGYAPVEQYTAHGRFGPGTDVYAFGATVYHMVTGQFPTPSLDRFAGHPMASPHDVNPDVSPAVSEAIMWAMAVESEERPESAGAFVRALEGAVSGAGATVTVAGDPLADLVPPEKTPTVDVSGGGRGDGRGDGDGADEPQSLRPPGRSKAKLALLILVPVLVLVAGGFGLTALLSDSEPTTTTVTSTTGATGTSAAPTTTTLLPPTTVAIPDWAVVATADEQATFDGPGPEYPTAFPLPVPGSPVGLPGDMAMMSDGIWIKISVGDDRGWAAPGTLSPSDPLLQRRVELKVRTTLLGVAFSVPDAWVDDEPVQTRVGPGGRFENLHRFAGGEEISATGNTAFVSGNVWAEVETPAGPGWVRTDRFDPDSITSLLGAERGLACADLVARGFDFAATVAYWVWDGRPVRLDGDGNGIPCEADHDPAEIAIFQEMTE